ncbi:hypothetical protein EN939_37780, partial [Mesorhizobium sp. M7A.F.Ca.CA.002.05.1.1]
MAVGVGGSAGSGGFARKVDVTTGGSVETLQDRSAGIVVQSLGGGGGNGGFVVEGALFGASVGIGGKGSGGGDGGDVFFRTANGGQQSIITRGTDSIGLVVQSVGGGGGNGGFVGTFGAIANLGIGGGGGKG